MARLREPRHDRRLGGPVSTPKERESDAITKKLNEIYDEEDSTLDPAIVAAQDRSLDEW